LPADFNQEVEPDGLSKFRTMKTGGDKIVNQPKAIVQANLVYSTL